MEPQFDMQRLLRREHEIRHAMRQPGGVRVTMERALYAIVEPLKDFPAAHRALQTDSVNAIIRR